MSWFEDIFNSFTPVKYENMVLKSTLSNYEDEEYNDAARLWNNKKPKANITYNGRTSPFDKKKMLDIDVRLFIQPNDSKIISDLNYRSMMIIDKAKCDDQILRIYKWHQQKYFNYEYDDNQFGIPEFWMFPHELRNLEKGDCDDYANSLASHLIAAGVPRFRVRVVCGTVWGYNKGGHATVYVLADDLKTWIHINSTSTGANVNNLLDLPRSNDPTDLIGIENVWFSYNDIYSWSVFETQSAEKSAKRYKKIKIGGKAK